MEKFFCAFRTFWIAWANVGVLGEWGKGTGVVFLRFYAEEHVLRGVGGLTRARYCDFGGDIVAFLALVGWIGVIFKELVGVGGGFLLALCLLDGSMGEF